jgi:hypothetical protein
MEAVKKLNVEKNGVKIPGVMDAVLQTQIAQLEGSIERRNPAEFQKAYDASLSACNGCHTESGHKFYSDSSTCCATGNQSKVGNVGQMAMLTKTISSGNACGSL